MARKSRRETLTPELTTDIMGLNDMIELKADQPMQDYVNKSISHSQH